MILDQPVIGEKIKLQSLNAKNCSPYYVDWMNDKEINKYLESKWTVHTKKSCMSFIEEKNKSASDYLLGIFTLENRHIGNIKIGGIHHIYKYADLGYVIGEKDMWGKGIATEAIHLACKICFEQLGLHRVYAGAYSVAAGSIACLEKNGFVREGVLRDKVIFDDQFIDCYTYSLLEDEFKRGK